MSACRLLGAALVVSLTFIVAPAGADTVVEPGVAVDPIDGDGDGAGSARALLESYGDVTVAVYVDARHDGVRAALVDTAPGAAPGPSIALDPSATLEDADLAGGPSKFLLVWSDAGAITGQLIAVDAVEGTITAESAFELVSGGPGASTPRASWGQIAWLVAFREGSGATGDIRRAFVDEDGVPSVFEGALVSSAGHFDLDGATSGFSLVYQATAGGDPVRAAEITALGSLGASSDLANADSGSTVRVAAEDGMGWAGWLEPSGDLSARRFSDTFQPLGGGAVSVATGSPSSIDLAEEAGAGWLIWEDGGAVQATHWADDDTLTGPFELLASDGASPDAADGTGQAQAAFVNARSGGAEVYALTLEVPTPGEAQLIAPRTTGDVIWTGSHFVAAWSEPASGGGDDVYLAELDQYGVLAGPAQSASAQSAHESEVALAFADSTLLVLWVEDDTDLRGRYYTGGDPEDPATDAFDLCSQEGGIGPPRAVGVGHVDADFLLVFENEDDDIAFRRISTGGTPASNCGAVLPGASSASLPRLAYDGTDVLAAWLTGASGSRRVVGVAIDDAGSAGTEFEILPDTADPVSFDLQALGTGAWLLASSQGGAIHLDDFTEAGLSGDTEVISPSGGEVLMAPRLAASAGVAQVAWQDGDSGDLYYNRYGGGDLLDGANVQIVAGDSALGGPLALFARSEQETALLTRQLGDGGGTERVVFRRVLTDLGPVSDAGGPYAGQEGDVLAFDGSGSMPLADIDDFDWSIGGSDYSGVTPSVTLGADGQVIATLTVTDTDTGLLDVDTALVDIANAPPQVTVPALAAADEGSAVSIGVNISDPGGDPLDIDFSFGDGDILSLDGVGPPYPSSRSHTYLDDDPETGDGSPYVVCVTVTDDGGETDFDCESIAIRNVAPTLVGSPPTTAPLALDSGGDPVPYEATLTVVDPGDDTIEYALSADGLEDEVTLDEGSDSVGIEFTPTLDMWRSRVPPIWSFSLSASDQDGGIDVETWQIEVTLTDEDDDDLPDICEALYGLTSPADTGSADADGDGVDNRKECLDGTDPSERDGPPRAPTLNAPADGATIDTLVSTLSVVNLPGSNGYLYEFELYRSPELALADLVRAVSVLEGLFVTETSTGTLVDGTTYYWRVRARDGPFVGPWMDVATFNVVLPNIAPTQPVGLRPDGPVATLTPAFSWENSFDADGDSVLYTLEIFSDAGLTTRERLVGNISEGIGTTTYTLSPGAALPDNERFYWSVTGVDDRGAESPPSAALGFDVIVTNAVPGTPTIVSPERGSVVATHFPELIVTSVEDPDGDEVTYAFVVAVDETFDNIVDSASEVLPDVDDLVYHTVNRELDENVVYYWRAAARDMRLLGGFVQGDFLVNSENDPPLAPVFQNPSQGQIVTTARPELVVRNSSDPDGDALTYDFELSDSASFADPLFSAYDVAEGEDDETGVAVDDDLPLGQSYQARARAVDELGLAGPWSATLRFHVQSDEVALVPPEPFLPEFGAVLTTGTVELGVENVELPEGTPAYDMAVYRDQRLEDQIVLVEGIPEGEEGVTVHSLDHQFLSGEYFWHARLVLDGDVSPWSDTWVFSIDLAGGGGDGAPDAGADTTGDGSDTSAQDAAEAAPGGDSGCGCGQAGNLPPAAMSLALLAICILLIGRRRSVAVEEE